jgi:hypothetical protein
MPIPRMVRHVRSLVRRVCRIAWRARLLARVCRRRWLTCRRRGLKWRGRLAFRLVEHAHTIGPEASRRLDCARTYVDNPSGGTMKARTVRALGVSVKKPERWALGRAHWGAHEATRPSFLRRKFCCSSSCAISLLILDMRFIRSSSDCAMLRARGLFHISITYPATYSSSGSAAMRTRPGQTRFSSLRQP